MTVSLANTHFSPANHSSLIKRGEDEGSSQDINPLIFFQKRITNIVSFIFCLEKEDERIDFNLNINFPPQDTQICSRGCQITGENEAWQSKAVKPHNQLGLGRIGFSCRMPDIWPDHPVCLTGYCRIIRLFLAGYRIRPDNPALRDTQPYLICPRFRLAIALMQATVTDE